jgi:GNAT superfamily N-acetyltransferase
MASHGTEVLLCPDPDLDSPDVRASADRASCILVDGDLGAPGPVALVRALRAAGCGTPIIAAVRGADDELARELLEAGATDVVGIALVYAYLMNRLGDFSTGTATSRPHTLTLRNGTEVAFRFLHPKDRDIEQAFVRGLSDQSRYMRFFTFLKELSPGSLEAFTHNEFPRSYAVIATVASDDGETQIGVARYAPTADDDTAEFAVVVADAWQRLGVASSLMHIIIVAAALAGYRHLDGVILRENAGMIDLSRKLGFRVLTEHGDGPGVIRVRKTLAA